MLNVFKENNRVCLAIRVERRCKAKDVVEMLEDLTSVYESKAFICGGNGPKFNTQALWK